MSRLTPLILAVVVGVLAFLAYRQTERETENQVVEATQLFQGVELRRVSAIRLEDIKSTRHMRFERDGGGRWFLTEPVAWPAEPGLMDKIFQIIQRNGASIVPEQLMAEAAPSFSPPRGFLETIETLENGEERRTRIEVGALDLDGMRVYVRRDGETLRTARNLETLFSLTSADFRSKRLFTLDPNSVAQVERIGGWYDQGAGESLDFLARPEGYGWRIHKPYRVQGDPTLLTLWSRFLCSAQAKRFVSDRPDVDLSKYNLDQPWVTIKLTSNGGSEQSIHLAADQNRVYAQRDGMANVFEIEFDTAQRFREPVEVFFEGAFVRVPRAEVMHVWISREAGDLRFTKIGDDWTVAERPKDFDEYSIELPADSNVMTDLLVETEKAEVLRYFRDLPVTEFFPGGRALRGLWVQPRTDVRQGGYVGDVVKTPQGTEVAPFLREGDTIVGSLAPEVLEWIDRPLDHYLDRQLWELQNIQMNALVIERDGKDRRFRRSPKDDWQPVDAQVPARELDPVLDHLLFLKVSRHVPEGERESLSDLVTIRFTDSSGNDSEAQIGVTPSGEAQVIMGALRGALKRQQLHADLMAIMDAKPDRE
ncbi:hypothetical protein Poly30_30030 [Planctomycetes bacterium Poly30]|uniref:DUF4340 domain-containing protein n=1 Tax=Saltatorellus ferox TaxID=2528018 RepID=A0A518ETQ7_9BACT|nr:hypothetical protein Poly30_30030 [Planctomycetes bacterium Poly30]